MFLFLVINLTTCILEDSEDDKPLKRKRRDFSAYQKQELEKEFLEKKKFNPNDIFNLAERLGCEEKQVKVWYRNRKIKMKQPFQLDGLRRKTKLLERSSRTGIISF